MSKKSNVVLVTDEDCDREIKKCLEVLGLFEAEARAAINDSTGFSDAVESLTYSKLCELQDAAEELLHWLWLKDA